MSVFAVKLPIDSLHSVLKDPVDEEELQKWVQGLGFTGHYRIVGNDSYACMDVAVDSWEDGVALADLANAKLPKSSYAEELETNHAATVHELDSWESYGREEREPYIYHVDRADSKKLMDESMASFIRGSMFESDYSDVVQELSVTLPLNLRFENSTGVKSDPTLTILRWFTLDNLVHVGLPIYQLPQSSGDGCVAGDLESELRHKLGNELNNDALDALVMAVMDKVLSLYHVVTLPDGSSVLALTADRSKPKTSHDESLVASVSNVVQEDSAFLSTQLPESITRRAMDAVELHVPVKFSVMCQLLDNSEFGIKSALSNIELSCGSVTLSIPVIDHSVIMYHTVTGISPNVTDETAKDVLHSTLRDCVSSVGDSFLRSAVVVDEIVKFVTSKFVPTVVNNHLLFVLSADRDRAKQLMDESSSNSLRANSSAARTASSADPSKLSDELLRLHRKVVDRSPISHVLAKKLLTRLHRLSRDGGESNSYDALGGRAMQKQVQSFLDDSDQEL